MYVASGSCSTSVRYFASASRSRSSRWWRFVTSRSETANSSGPGTSTRVIASSAGNDRWSERSAVISRRAPSSGLLPLVEDAGEVSAVAGRHDELEERLAERVGARPAERLLGRGVHLDDQSFVVDDHDAVERGAEDRVLARLARGEQRARSACRW